MNPSSDVGLAAKVHRVAGNTADADADTDEVNVIADDVAEILSARFGVRASRVRVVGAESAAVFRVDRADGPPVAVKTFWADSPSGEVVRWHQEVVDRVAEAGLPVARPLRSTDGELTVESRTATGNILFQVSDWLTGTPLQQVPLERELLHEIGRVAARLHRCLLTESAPRNLEEHVWQITGSRLTIENAFARIGDLRERGQLEVAANELVRLHRAAEKVFAVLEERVAPRLSRLPHTVVHHDLHDSNLLVAPEPEARIVTGILDFGDMTSSVRISEPTIAGAYAARHADDPVAALNEVVSGWSETVTVTADEAAVVLPLAAARLLTNATVWMSRLGTSRGEYAASRRLGSLETAEAMLEVL